MNTTSSRIRARMGASVGRSHSQRRWPQQSEEPRRLADNEPQASQVGGTRRQLMARWRRKNRKATNGQARQSAAVPPARALQGLRSTFAKQARGIAARTQRYSQTTSRTSDSAL